MQYVIDKESLFRETATAAKLRGFCGLNHRHFKISIDDPENKVTKILRRHKQRQANCEIVAVVHAQRDTMEVEPRDEPFRITVYSYVNAPHNSVELRLEPLVSFSVEWSNTMSGPFPFEFTKNVRLVDYSTIIDHQPILITNWDLIEIYDRDVNDDFTITEFRCRDRLGNRFRILDGCRDVLRVIQDLLVVDNSLLLGIGVKLSYDPIVTRFDPANADAQETISFHAPNGDTIATIKGKVMESSNNYYQFVFDEFVDDPKSTK